jgi:hypothetical protein
MKKSRLFATVSGVAVIGAAATLAIAVVPAQAAASIPGPAQTCSSGQPKLDYEYGSYNMGYFNGITWSNVCGTGTWTLYNPLHGLPLDGNFIQELRMPTSPYHRIWLHQDANGGGLTACFYSQDTDIILDNYVNQYGSWIKTPGNIQVSDNTSPC